MLRRPSPVVPPDAGVRRCVLKMTEASYAEASVVCRASGLLQQEALAVERGDAARTGGGDGLPVGGILYVAGREDPFDGGFRRIAFGADIPLGIEFQLVAEQFGVGVVANGHEESRNGERPFLTVVVADRDARDARVVAQHLGGVVVEHHFDVGGVEHPLLHGLRSAQVGLAHDHVDLAADRGQIGGLLAGRVAAADHGHVLLAVEESVARGARADAHAAEFRFRRQAEVFCRCSRGDDERLGLDLRRAVDHHVERTRREVRARHGSDADVGSEAFGLTAHVGHHLLAADAVGIARKILHVGRGCELPARLDTLVEYGPEVGARSIDSCGVPCGAAADNQAFDRFFHCRMFCDVVICKFRTCTAPAGQAPAYPPGRTPSDGGPDSRTAPSVRRGGRARC